MAAINLTLRPGVQETDIHVRDTDAIKVYVHKSQTYPAGDFACLRIAEGKGPGQVRIFINQEQLQRVIDSLLLAKSQLQV